MWIPADVYNPQNKFFAIKKKFSNLISGHRLEPHRLSEADTIFEMTKPIFESNSPQIWTGDFNALTREDYSENQWKELSDVRHKNCWEQPLTELTTKVSLFD
jgi:hypothetical protein